MPAVLMVGADMGLTYFKRFRMEFDLSRPLFERPPMPAGYAMLPWRDSLLSAHADVKYRSFCFEIDANVFPCLGDREGCLRLMQEISSREAFLREATWLVTYRATAASDPEPCGTIQGIRDRSGLGAVQNVGIIPEHRRLGLGTSLLYHGLRGFQEVGLRRAFLEVTAQNCGALRLYERLGFRTVKTVYKAAEVAYA